MFWKRVRNFISGLRLRATLGFAVMLGASSALCLFSTAALLERKETLLYSDICALKAKYPVVPAAV